MNKHSNNHLELCFYTIGSALALFIIVSIFLPEFYFYISSLKSGGIFFYVNAWDEETYLSYQGAIGNRNYPGYYGLYLISFLHECGVSGAIQNLLFDLVFIPLTIFFTTSSLHSIIKNRRLAFFYAVIILFSSVLFNYCNPLIEFLYGDRHLTTFISGWESYPSFIRTPNPLFSYFILSLAIYLFSITRKKWVLLLPFLFLYYFVFQPYLYCLSVISLAYFFKNKNSYFAILLFNVASFFLISGFAYFAYAKLLSTDTTHLLNYLVGTQHIQIGRSIYFPIYTLCSITLFIFAIPLGLLKNKQRTQIFISLILCTFFISNIQLVTGFSIEIKNFQDYGNSLIMGVILVLFLESIKCGFNNLNERSVKSDAGTLILLTFIAYCCFHLLNTPSMQLNVKQHMNTLSKSQVLQIKASPLTSLVLDRDIAAKISYSQAKMPSLLTSYTMNYPAIFQQCSCFYQLAREAQKYLKTHHNIKNLALETTLQNMQNISFSGKNKAFCVHICPVVKSGMVFTVFE